MAENSQIDPWAKYEAIWAQMDAERKEKERSKQVIDEFFGMDDAAIVNAASGNYIPISQEISQAVQNTTPVNGAVANRARRVVPEILYDGIEIGLSKRCTSISYTDNDEGKVDEITLAFEDRAAEWMMFGWIPEKGHDIDVTLWFTDWTKPGDNQKYHCGNFTVDDLTYTGPPWTCTVKAVSILAESDMQTEQKSKTWENATLKQIVEEKMAIYNMPLENLYWYGDTPVIAKVEQDKQTDSAFLKQLCEKQGMFLKIYKRGMVVFDKKVYEPRPAKAGFGLSDVEPGSLNWNDTLNGTYTGAILSYTNPNKKKNSDNKQLISIEVGDCSEGARILRLNQHVDDEAEAQRVAIAGLNAANEKGCTVSFKTLANVNMFATDNFLLSGFGRLDGKYYCKSVTHSLSRSGHSMSVSGYKIWGRL